MPSSPPAPVASLLSTLDPVLRPSPVPAALFSSIEEILNFGPSSSTKLLQLMKSNATPSPAVYTAHDNAVNVPSGRGGAVALILVLVSRHSEDLPIAGTAEVSTTTTMLGRSSDLREGTKHEKIEGVYRP